MEKNRFPRFFIFFLVILVIFPSLRADEKTLENFLTQTQKALEAKDFDSYLNSFTPEARDAERQALSSYFQSREMETVVSKVAGLQRDSSGEERAFLQVLFQNAYAAIIETWQLVFEKEDGERRIKKKFVSWSEKGLYKIQIPSDRAERAESVEVTSPDIRLVFNTSLIFYDNIPGQETALLILGKGGVRFAPSNPAESHQLQLIYKKNVLEDRLQYVFIRGSDLFFKNNIVIKKSHRLSNLPVTQAEREKASEIFIKNYQRSFTIENSLTGQVFSFIPQADEAIFEFKGRRRGELTYLYSPFADEEVTFFDRSTERIINTYSPQKEGETNMRRFFVTIGERFDIQDYKIDLDYSPRKSYLSVRARIQFSSLADTLQALRFHFSPDLEILRILDAEKRELFYTKDDLRKLLYIYLVEPRPRGESSWIEIYYRGKIIPVSPNTDAVEQTNIRDAYTFFWNANKLKYDTYFLTHSALWYPASSDDDYFTSRLKIVVPPEYNCVSNGELIEKGNLGDLEDVEKIEKTGNSYFVFEAKTPIKQLAFIIGNFINLENGSDPIPLSLLSSVELDVDKKESFGMAQDILKDYVRWFGPFPFEGLSVLRRPWSSDGGNSPAGFIILNELPRTPSPRLIAGRRNPVDLSHWKEYFLAHEIAHQWWGQGVSWTSYRDQWLSEGMAQFAAAFFLRERYGEAAYVSILKKFSQWTEKKSVNGPIIMGSRLSYNDFEAYQSIIYDKSALVLNMLRDLMGDELFFNGLQAFFRDHRARTAGTGQFRRAMEEASGMDLKAFFRGWFDSYELPDVKVSYHIEKAGEVDILSGSILQQKTEFFFPLWVEWKAGGVIHRDKVIVDSANKNFTIRLFGKPSCLRINPDQAVPGNFH